MIKLSWRTLQNKVSGKLNTDSIDKILDGQSSPGSPWRGQRAALRVSVGAHAPDWVHLLSGSLNWEQGTPGSYETGGVVPRFWTDGMLDSYMHLQELLAARYDDDERIARVDLGMPVSLYSPEVCGIGATRTNRATLADLGWSPDLHASAFDRAVEAHAQLWKRTPTAAAFAPLPQLNGSRSVQAGLDMMKSFRDKLGERACTMTTFANPDKIANADYRKFLEAQGDLRDYSCVQTASWLQLVEDTELSSQDALKETLAYAHTVASSVELPQRYATVLWPELESEAPDRVREVLGPWV